jgi:hypothetical protein
MTNHSLPLSILSSGYTSFTDDGLLFIIPPLLFRIPGPKNTPGLDRGHVKRAKPETGFYRGAVTSSLRRIRTDLDSQGYESTIAGKKKKSKAAMPRLLYSAPSHFFCPGV